MFVKKFLPIYIEFLSNHIISFQRLKHERETLRTFSYQFVLI